MSEMVDRVAKGLCEQMPSLGSPSAPMVVSLARAAIAAMRNPTEAMRDEAEHSAGCAYDVMIDEALK